jgi:hypothetical protein
VIKIAEESTLSTIVLLLIIISDTIFATIWLYIRLVSTASLNHSIRPISDVLFDINGGPCFVTICGRQINSRSLTESLKDLKSRATGLKYEAEKLQLFVS